MIIQSNALNMPLQDCAVDAIVTDPPYGLEFMGKEWDKLWEKTRKKGTFHNDTTFFNHRTITAPNYQAGIQAQLWHTQWLTEAYRVLKPGGSMLVMGGTRTFHRLMCAIEDSGFIIKDTLMWIYGSGFPKAQDLGKMIDKRYKKKPEYYELAEFIKQARIGLGKSINDIAILFPSKTGGITGCVWNWENAKNVPTMEQWQTLKKELGLSNKFNWLIEQETKRWEEAEREKIGKDKHWGQAGGSIGIGGQEWDLSLAETDLAKYWNGFKVGGIKPAYEPIVWAVKPPEGSYVDNVLKHGVGAVNVDECRIEGQVPKTIQGASKNKYGGGKGFCPDGYQESQPSPKGRFPANLILSHHPECVQVGMKRVKPHNGSGIAYKENLNGHVYNKHGDWGLKAKQSQNKTYLNPNGFETVESWDCHPDCPVKVMDEQSGDLKTGDINPHKQNLQLGIQFNTAKRVTSSFKGDSGGASRFFYCAKASRSERNAGLEGTPKKDACHYNQSGRRYGGGNRENWKDPYKKPQFQNNHPTVKPIKLFEWLIRLVTREGQTVLDPFLGSGTTAISAHNIGRKCIGIEKEGEYIEIAKRRVEYHEGQPRQGILL